MRHLLDIADLSVSEINELIALAEDIAANGQNYAEAGKGKKLAALFRAVHAHPPLVRGGDAGAGRKRHRLL